MKNKWLRGVLVGAAAVLAAAALDAVHAFRHFEWKTWDIRMRLFADPAQADRDIVLVLVDQYSLDLIKKEQAISWPWPREIYKYLVGYLKEGGAAACYFDFALSDDSIRGVDDDAALARAMADAGNVVLPLALSVEDEESDEAGIAKLRRFAWPAGAPARAGQVCRSITLPIPAFLDAAGGVANVLVNPDDDGIYRRTPLSFRFRDLVLPSVPLALAGPRSPSSVPTDAAGNMIVRFFGRTGTYPSYRIAALLNSAAQIQQGKTPQIAPSEFRGKTVLVGLTAVGLFDLKSSPLSAVIPGAEIQAAALDTLLHKAYFKPIAPIPTLALALAFALGAGIVVSRARKPVLVVPAFALFLALPAAASCAAFAAGAWLDFVFPEAGVLFALIGASVLNYSIEGRERRFLKGVFSHYLSPAVIERILADPELVRLGGEEREITSFFSDVAGFTSISESLKPADLVRLLNEYLSEMTDLLLDAGGTLDKYEGDAIVAFWNAPLDVPGHALCACRTALACGRRLAEIRPELERRYGHGLRMRIGLNTGPAVVGNMGSGRRFDYTAMGDTVNLAARLESAGKQYGVSLLAGEATVAAAGEEILAREADLIRVVGKARPVRIYELLGERAGAAEADLERQRRYHEALGLFRGRDWERSKSAFEALGGDPLARIYVERCRTFLREAPPADWDGVFDLKAK